MFVILNRSYIFNDQKSSVVYVALHRCPFDQQETRISDFYLSGVKAQSKTIVGPFSTQGVGSWPPRLLVRRFPALAAATLGLVMSDPQPKPPHPALIIPRIPKKSVHYGSASQEYITCACFTAALSTSSQAVHRLYSPGVL